MSEGDTRYHTSDGSALTPAEIARLDEIESRLGGPDDSPAAFGTAVPADMIPIRLDPDVRAWLRAKGKRYQAEVNRILRERMLAEG
jgi:uncharacterized protein (DUF4415 family)